MGREDTINEWRGPAFGSQGCRQTRSRRFSIGPDAPDIEPERSLPEPRRRRAGFTVRPTTQRLSCNSPSSASTTSLAQLRERLTVLSPFEYRKATTKIAAPPNLPALKEEYERCGVSCRKKYHSDSDAHNITKNSRYLSPIVEQDTTSSPDQLAKIQAIEKLHKRALNHGLDKDSGITSGKVTQDSDIVENTPFAETAHRKKLGLKAKPTDIQENRYTTDDSDVIDDTPCYDYGSRKRGRSKSNKANNSNSDENEKKAVDEYFCQETNIHYSHVISPDTVKKISESISQDADGEDDCNALGLAVEADIVDCVNDILDKVCNDIDKCVNVLAIQQQKIDISRAIQDINDKSNNTSKIVKMNKDTLTSPKNISDDTDGSDGVQKVTLKFPKTQAPKKNTSRQKRAKCVKSLNNIEEDGNSNKSATNATKQSIRKKRKLYSPKDNDDDFPRSRKERRQLSSTKSPIAACYKELENARKSRITRKSYASKKKTGTQPVISPKTKKLNDIFDKIKDNVVNNETITLVDKKSEKNLSLYNLSSESDDEAFKKKKIQVQKRISSSSLESATKRRRSVKPINYTSYYSSEDDCQRVVKPKAVKQTKPRSRKLKSIQGTGLIDERMRTEQPEVLETSFVQEIGEMNLPDEPQPAVNAPVLEAIPADVLHEPIVSGRKSQTPNKQDMKKKMTEKSLKKRCEKLTKPTITKKSKEIIKNVPTEKESATVSPLPGLVVETEPSKEDLTSSLDAFLLQKLKKIYTDEEDLSTTRHTQNLLLNENNNDGLEVDLLSKTCYKQSLPINSNDNAVAADNVPDVNSEKSIEIGGRSLITDQDLNESPPNLDALEQSFEGTSPIIPVTGMSTKDSARSNKCVNKISKLNRKPSDTSTYIESDKSNPRVVLERLSTDIESQMNTVTPKSEASTSRTVLTRKSSEEKEKIVTPNRTKKSSTTKSPVVHINRVPSEEINKWLPMPETNDVIEKEPEIIPRKPLTRRNSTILKPCVTCDSFKQKISPVKLNFGIQDLTSVTPNRNTKTKKRSRSRTRSVQTIKSPSIIEKSRTQSVESLLKEVNDQGQSSQKKSVVKSAQTININICNEPVGSTVNPSEISEANVQRWILKNAEASASQTDDIAAYKKMVYEELMEVLNTRLVEINEPTAEAMHSAFVKVQEELSSLAEQCRCLAEAHRKHGKTIDSLRQGIYSLQTSNKERAGSFNRAVAENKARMVRLLKADIEQILK